MFDWLTRLLGAPSSSRVAKERLRLVLLSDHLALAPEVINSLRSDLLEVLSRYVEVDEEHCDVTFEHQDAGIAMLANIPILALRNRPPAQPKSGNRNGNGTGHGAPRRRKRKAAEASTPAPAQ